MAETRERADVAFFARLGAVERLAAQRLERALPVGLSAAGLAALSQIARLPTPPTPRDMARALLLSKPAITNTLQRLERLGLIALSDDPADGRRKRLTLTASGASMLKAASAAVRPRLDEVREAFTVEEFAAALPFLDRLGAWLAMHP